MVSDPVQKGSAQPPLVPGRDYQSIYRDPKILGVKELTVHPFLPILFEGGSVLVNFLRRAARRSFL